MAKLHLDRLRKRHGFTGGSYRELMGKIVLANSESVANAVGRISQENFARASRRVGTGEARFILPDVSEVLPKRSVFIRKAAESGKVLSDTLRTRLTSNLRDALNTFTATGEQAMVRRRGRAAGTISPKLIREFEDSVRGTFQDYRRRDPKFGVPANVRAIAVTEVRSTVDDIKQRYAVAFTDQNPDVEMTKVWIHNRALSRQPRPGHLAAHGQTVALEERFRIETFQDSDGRSVRTGSVLMLHPHDPLAPASEVIGCNCEIEYRARRIPARDAA